jgi:hypothetical protein
MSAAGVPLTLRERAKVAAAVGGTVTVSGDLMWSLVKALDESRADLERSADEMEDVLVTSRRVGVLSLAALVIGVSFFVLGLIS